jgi:hypothetical protein
MTLVARASQGRSRLARVAATPFPKPKESSIIAKPGDAWVIKNRFASYSAMGREVDDIGIR